MFATLYLPNFFLQAALRHQPETAAQPVGLIDGEETKALLLQLNEAAEKAGLRSGMTPSQGLARCLSLIVKARLRAQEDLLGALLLQFAFSLAPFVEATAPGMCTVEFTDEKNLQPKVARVLEQLTAAGLRAQAGIAPTADTSFLAAHMARPILQVEEPKDFLAPLPIETLAIF